MTREEFISILDEKGYSYEIEGDKIVVTEDGHVYLRALTSIPPGVKFNTKGNVYLDALTSIPSGVSFTDEVNDILFVNLTSIAPGVLFKNRRNVHLSKNRRDAYLSALTSILPTSILPGVVFRNGGDVYFSDVIDGWFGYWREGNIEGIDSKRLLNVMISKGLFER
jgi:hypothetical protein